MTPNQLSQYIWKRAREEGVVKFNSSWKSESAGNPGSSSEIAWQGHEGGYRAVFYSDHIRISLEDKLVEIFTYDEPDLHDFIEFMRDTDNSLPKKEMPVTKIENTVWNTL